MRPSGAHIKLGDHEFLIDEEVGNRASTYIPHYNHGGASLLANRTNVDGKPGRQNVKPWVFYFAQDDWSGGLGAKFYNPNRVSRYYRGSGNPRIEGYLTSQPQRTNTLSPTTALMSTPCFASGGGFLYMANSDDVPVGHSCTIYQWDGVAWDSSEVTLTDDGTPSWNRNLAVDQGGRAYLVAGGPVTMGRINVVKPDLSSSVFFSEFTSGVPTGSNLGARGAAVHLVWLYCWTGVNLYRFDTTATPHPVDAHFVGGFASGVGDANATTGRDDAGNFIANADIVNCGDGVAMFTSTVGGANHVYQYRRTDPSSTDLAFSQLWSAPSDVILWSICYNNGVVYVAGSQDRGVTVWAIQLPGQGQAAQATPVVRILPDQESFDV